jgi:hypothetical protein
MQFPGPIFISISVQMAPENYGYALRKSACRQIRIESTGAAR